MDRRFRNSLGGLPAYATEVHLSSDGDEADCIFNYVTKLIFLVRQNHGPTKLIKQLKAPAQVKRLTAFGSA